MNNLKISLYALFDLCMKLYDFSINNGVDFASTVNIILTENKADIYITSAGSDTPLTFSDLN